MQTVEENIPNVDVYQLGERILKVKEKILSLPPFLREGVLLECFLVEDFFRDKFTRSLRRNKKTGGKKVGGANFFPD